MEGLNKVKLGKKADFKTLCEQYFEDIKSPLGLNIIANEVALIKPIIKEAYEILGEEKMRNLGLECKKIETELITQNGLKSKNWKIVKLLDLRIGEWVSTSKLKEKITQAYDELNLVKTAKATDAQEWYELRSQSKRVDGTLTKGFVIVSNKIKIK
jgi:hypothetical protein